MSRIERNVVYGLYILALAAVVVLQLTGHIPPWLICLQAAGQCP